MRLFDQKIEIFTTSEQGAWGDHLAVVDSYPVLRHVLQANDGVRLGAEMYLDSSYMSLAHVSPRELQSTNLRVLLEHRFGISSSRVTHEVFTEILDARKAALFGMKADTLCFRLEARTMANNGQPFYYQQIYAPADAVSLSF